MRSLLTISLVFLFQVTQSQSTSFVDSLGLLKGVKYFVFVQKCIGCIVMDSCVGNNGEEVYVFWTDGKKEYFRKIDSCGSDRIIPIKRRKKSPFGVIQKFHVDLDTASLKYPMTFVRQDSSWVKLGVSHYYSYSFNFHGSWDIREIVIYDFLFRQPEKGDFEYAQMNIDFRHNQPYYIYNNHTCVMKLLNQVHRVVSQSGAFENRPEHRFKKRTFNK